MIQKWLLALLADRGWRYLRNRQSRKQVQRNIEPETRQVAKRKQQQERKQQQGGFKPGRLLTLLVLGAGAYLYRRSRQQPDTWNDQPSVTPFDPIRDVTPPSTSATSTPSTAYGTTKLDPSSTEIPDPNQQRS